jgi:hypothetical protein
MRRLCILIAAAALVGPALAQIIVPLEDQPSPVGRGVPLTPTQQPAVTTPPIGQGGGAPAPPFVQMGTHQIVGGPTPKTVNNIDVATGCGSDSIVQGSDMAGRIIFGSTSVPANGCAVAWTSPWPGWPVLCVASLLNGTNPVLPPSASFAFQPGGAWLRFFGFQVGDIAVWHCTGVGP